MWEPCRARQGGAAHVAPTDKVALKKNVPPPPKEAWGGDPLKQGPPQPAYVGGGIYTNSKQGEWTEQGGDVPVIGTHSHHYGIQ